MEFKRPKIELYRVRTFSEKISDTFDFIRESWRPMIKYFIYLMLPVSMVMAYFINHFMTSYVELALGGSDNIQTMMGYGLTILGAGVVSCVAAVLLSSLVYALIRLYQWRADRLNGLQTSELRPELRLCAGRVVRLLLAGLLIGVLIVLLLGVSIALLTTINPAFGILLIMVVYIAVLVVMLPISLTLPIYMMEDDISIVEALQKAWRLGFATWGGIFAVTFVLSIIGSALQMLTFLPWYVLVLVKTFFTAGGEPSVFMNSIGYVVLQYLSCVWMCLGYMLVSVLTIVGLTVQYGHASDKIDGTGVARKIERFDELDSF